MSKRRFSVAAASRPLHRGLYQAQEPVSAVLPTRPRPHSLLRQGKHVGRTFEDVAKEDRSYVEWALREGRSGELSPNLAAFAQYVKTEFGGLMTVGRTKTATSQNFSMQILVTPIGAGPPRRVETS